MVFSFTVVKLELAPMIVLKLYIGVSSSLQKTLQSLPLDNERRPAGNNVPGLAELP